MIYIWSVLHPKILDNSVSDVKFCGINVAFLCHHHLLLDLMLLVTGLGETLSLITSNWGQY